MGLNVQCARVYIRVMTPMAYIRREKLKLTQVGMARVAGVTQATVSRWEQECGGLEPDRKAMDAIRTYASEHGIEWHDRWFFEAPPASEAAA